MVVAVAMSGGVDSTVVAALLKQSGFEVIGVSMVGWRHSLCCSFEDVARARLMARRLGIRHYLIDLMEAFRDQLVMPYVEARLQGLTPNPCPSCNRDFKFGRMLAGLRRRTPAEALASGHYARLCVDPVSHRLGLRRASEVARDQSYMLWQLSQAQLRQLLFPLGELSKADVRAYARDLDLPEVAARPDSQDLCFLVPDQPSFWQEQADGRYGPGDLVDASGKVLGQHKGMVFYTPGQRRGLGVSADTRLYVQSLCPSRNQIQVGPAPEPQFRRLRLQQLNWVACEPQSEPLTCLAQTRLHGKMVLAQIHPNPGLSSAWVEFKESIVQVAAGQSVVCYSPDGDVLLGGIVSPEQG